MTATRRKQITQGVLIYLGIAVLTTAFHSVSTDYTWEGQNFIQHFCVLLSSVAFMCFVVFLFAMSVVLIFDPPKER